LAHPVAGSAPLCASAACNAAPRDGATSSLAMSAAPRPEWRYAAERQAMRAPAVHALRSLVRPSEPAYDAESFTAAA
jgi:hypothetical protein